MHRTTTSDTSAALRSTPESCAIRASIAPTSPTHTAPGSTPTDAQFVAAPSTAGSHPTSPRVTHGATRSNGVDLASCTAAEPLPPAPVGRAKSSDPKAHRTGGARWAHRVTNRQCVCVAPSHKNRPRTGQMRNQRLGIPRGIPGESSRNPQVIHRFIHTQLAASCTAKLSTIPQAHCSPAADQGICPDLLGDSSRNPWGFLEESPGYPRFAAQCAQPGKNGGTTRGLLEDGH